MSVTQAPGSDGIAPPLARIASRLSAAPSATMGSPGGERLRRSAANTATVDATWAEGGRGHHALGDQRMEQHELEGEPQDRHAQPPDVEVGERGDATASHGTHEQSGGDRIEQEHREVGPFWV